MPCVDGVAQTYRSVSVLVLWPLFIFLLKMHCTTSQSPNASIQTNQRQLGQTTKRKNLSMAKQQVMDAERQKAIDLYRMMKDKKVKIS
jgi:hypothetical protein